MPTERAGVEVNVFCFGNGDEAYTAPGGQATPVYFYSMDAQLKALIDRTVSRWSDFGRFRGTEFWHIITAADTNRDMMPATLEGLRGFMRDCMEGITERGMLYETGAYEKGEVRALPVFKEAYEAGRSC